MSITTSFAFEPDKDILDVLAQAVENEPKRVSIAIQQDVLPRFRQFALTKLQQQPGSPRYPLRWASDRQRRYVMRLLRSTGNLPYQRTGKLARSWEVVYFPNDRSNLVGTVIFQNKSDIARYVYGDDQQPFHEDTGWYQFDDVAIELTDELQDRIIDVALEFAP